MENKPIRTDTDHEAALLEIEVLWGATEGTEAGDRLDVLVTLTEAYEECLWLTSANDDALTTPHF